jgi:hypothetical protein
MDRKRSIGMAGGTVLLALGAGQYMQSGSAQSSAAMAPVPRAEVAAPLRLAAGTPLSAHEPALDAQIIPAALSDPEPATLPEPQLTPASLAEACPVTLDAFAAADAILSISLTAPCRPNQTVVLSHAGLAVTYQTTATGALFADIPAMDASGALSIRFADGQLVEARAPMPEVAALRRLAVQWMQDDRFLLTGEEAPFLLGTLSGPVPMQAQVITLSSDTEAPLVIEAEVTDQTCGRELLAEVLYSEAGLVTRADLSLAMPDCDGAGGFVALNNPLPDMKLAAAR